MARKKIYIDRRTWRTGGTPDEPFDDSRLKAAKSRGPYRTGEGYVTHLENKEGYMCCLGFITDQACPDVPIFGLPSPSDTGCEIPGLSCSCKNDNTGDISFHDTSLAEAAMEINDDVTLTSRKKELALRKLFKNSPYQLVFTGEYSEYSDSDC